MLIFSLVAHSNLFSMYDHLKEVALISSRFVR